MQERESLFVDQGCVMSIISTLYGSESLIIVQVYNVLFPSNVSILPSATYTDNFKSGQ